MVAHRHSFNKPYTKDALRILAREIIEIKKMTNKDGDLVLSIDELLELQEMCNQSWNFGDKKPLFDMVKKLNCKRYFIGRMYKMTVQYTQEHGQTFVIEIDYKV